MLYDPKWEVKHIRTYASLIAWLESQNPAEKYCFMDTGDCLLHRYFTACGLKNVEVGGLYFTHQTSDGEQDERLPLRFEDVAAQTPHTYGAALKRARVALSAD